jgi:hypothetical protein
MRSNIICSFAAVFAVLTQFSAVFVAFALPATADQPATTISITQEQAGRGLGEVVVEVRRAI